MHVELTPRRPPNPIRDRRGQPEGAEAVESVLDIDVVVPESAAEAAAWPLAGCGVIPDGGPVESVGGADLLQRPGAREGGEQVGGGDAVVGAEAAFTGTWT